MQQNELAKLLDISPAMVSRLKKQGMPTDSLERAERWRKRHLEPGRIKGSRFDPKKTAKPPAPKPAPAPAAWAGALVAEIESAGALLDSALREGDDAWAGLMFEELRDLLRQAPPETAPLLTLRVWRRLTAWFIDPACEAFQAPDADSLLTPVQFGMRWHGWPEYPLMNEHTLDAACDWRDVAVNGWPECPDDDDLDAAAAEA